MSRKRSYTALDLLFFDWGFTLARLGIHFCAIGDLQNRDWGLTEKASLRLNPNEGSFAFKRGLGCVQTRARTFS